MKILVTGATGFIGGNLTRVLLKKGYEVICPVRKTSRTDLLEKAGAQLAEADITSERAVENVFSERSPEVVFHCAARVKDKNEEELFRVNIEGTRNVCRACYKHGVGRLVYLSSVAVVSGNPQVPLTDDLPYKAGNVYGRSKADAERIVMDFREKGLNISVIRPCMVYGRDEPHALDKILRAADSRCLPILNVPGMDSKLNLVYIGNVVDALCLALEKEEALHGTFMIADKEVITLRRFLEILYDELGKGRPPVVPSPVAGFLMAIPFFRKKADKLFKDRVYDITRARDMLGYDPKVSTEEGLRQTIRYWKVKNKK